MKQSVKLKPEIKTFIAINIIYILIVAGYLLSRLLDNISDVSIVNFLILPIGALLLSAPVCIGIVLLKKGNTDGAYRQLGIVTTVTNIIIAIVSWYSVQQCTGWWAGLGIAFIPIYQSLAMMVIWAMIFLPGIFKEK